jgi:hypothetical protein
MVDADGPRPDTRSKAFDADYYSFTHRRYSGGLFGVTDFFGVTRRKQSQN